MPLQAVEAPSYLHRTRLFIDTDDRNVLYTPNETYNAYDIEVELDTLYERVVAIELVDYNIKRDITKTFHSSTVNNGPGNNWLDVKMTNADNAEELEFSIDMGDRNYSLATELYTDMEALLNSTMDAQGSAYYSTTAGTPVTWTVAPSTDLLNSLAHEEFNTITRVTIVITVERAGSDVFAQFQFKTGPHASDDMHQILGYTDADTIIPPPSLTFAGTVQSSTQLAFWYGNLQSFEYVDVFVKEAPELQPVERINIAKTLEEDVLYETEVIIGNNSFRGFLQSMGMGNTTEHDYETKHRILVDPIKRMDTMHIRFAMPDGSRPIELHQGGVDLVFDVYTIEPQANIPRWVNQRTIY
jgi:hypothetical protein